MFGRVYRLEKRLKEIEEQLLQEEVYKEGEVTYEKGYASNYFPTILGKLKRNIKNAETVSLQGKTFKVSEIVELLVDYLDVELVIEPEKVERTPETIVMQER